MNTFNQPQMSNPYAAFSTPPQSDSFAPNAPLKHSGMGIASFVLALIAGISLIVLIVVAGYMEASTPGGVDEDSPALIVLGLFVCGGAIASLVGIALGVAACVQRQRNKLFAILGLTLNGLITVGVGGLMVIGMVMP